MSEVPPESDDGIRRTLVLMARLSVNGEAFTVEGTAEAILEGLATGVDPMRFELIGGDGTVLLYVRNAVTVSVQEDPLHPSTKPSSSTAAKINPRGKAQRR